MKFRKSMLAVSLVIGLGASSCLGPNKLFNSLNDWNQEATEQDWLNEAIFLGFNLIPVYGIAYLADVFVTNTIDYWGGDDE